MIPTETDKQNGLIGVTTGILQSLSEGNGVREALAEGGRLHIDRPLPFLCVYRFPPERIDKGTAHLIMG